MANTIFHFTRYISIILDSLPVANFLPTQFLQRSVCRICIFRLICQSSSPICQWLYRCIVATDRSLDLIAYMLILVVSVSNKRHCSDVRWSQLVIAIWAWNFQGHFGLGDAVTLKDVFFFKIITRNTIFAAATREARELGETLRLENRREGRVVFDRRILAQEIITKRQHRKWTQFFQFQ